VTESFGVVSESSDSSVGQDGRITTSYERTYLFRTDSSTRPSPAAISMAMGIYPGSPFSDDPNATAHRFSVKPGPKMTRPPWLAYLVTIGWATNSPTPLVASTETDPTSRRTIWTIKSATQQRHVIKYPDDPDDVLIVNTAGQPFDGGIPVNVRTGIITASRNVAAAGYDKGQVMRYSGALNLGEFLGAEPGTVQVDIEASEKYEGAYHFWEELYTFHYDPEGHQPKPVSAGFFQRESVGSNTLVEITTNGKRVREPEPLDEDGILVPVADRPSGCYFVDVPYFDEIDFSIFGLT